MKYSCGSEVMVGDIIERVNPSLSLVVGGHYTVVEIDDITGRYFYVQVGAGTHVSHNPDYFKLIQRKGKKLLERNKGYDVKLTGEQIALCKIILGKINGNHLYGAYKVFQQLFPEHPSLGSSGVDLDLTNLSKSDHTISKWLGAVFAPLETEDQRKLRELKEQYESLGKAIDAMEKK